MASAGTRRGGEIVVEIDERRPGQMSGEVFLAARRAAEGPANVEQRRRVALQQGWGADHDTGHVSRRAHGAG